MTKSWTSLFIVTFLLGYVDVSAQTKVWSLKECIDQALHRNIQLNQERLGNEVNKINYDQSKANFLPNLNFTDVQSFGISRSQNTTTDQYSNIGRQATTGNVATLSSSMTLFNGLKYKNLLKENQLIYQAGALDIEKNQNDLMLQVTAAYMQVLLAYEAVEIEQSQIEATTEHLDYTGKYVKVGSLPASALLQSEAQLAADKAAKVNAESQLSLAKLALMQLMEISSGNEFEIERPQLKEIPADIALSSPDIYVIAERTLPEIKSATLKTDASGAGLKISRSEIVPRITLGGSLSTAYYSNNRLYQNTTGIREIGYLENTPSEKVLGTITTPAYSGYPFYNQFWDNFGPSLNLNLFVPIFNNKIYRSDISRAEIAVQVAKLHESAVKNQLRKDIEFAYTDLVNASKNYAATKEQLAAEERAFADIQKKYKQGLVTSTDYLVEKENYNRAALTHIQAKYVYQYKSKIVSFYTGNLQTQ